MRRRVTRRAAQSCTGRASVPSHANSLTPSPAARPPGETCIECPDILSPLLPFFLRDTVGFQAETLEQWTGVIGSAQFAGVLLGCIVWGCASDRIGPKRSVQITMVGDLVLFTAFGAGLSRGAALMRWGPRIEPVSQSDAALPLASESALEIIRRHAEPMQARLSAGN